MAEQARHHEQVLRERLARARTLIVGGPRQVGKTVACLVKIHLTEAGIGTTRYLILTMTLPLVRPFST